MPTYQVITLEAPFEGQNIQRNNEDGTITIIPFDPANSDYQAYLASQENN